MDRNRPQPAVLATKLGSKKVSINRSRAWGAVLAFRLRLEKRSEGIWHLRQHLGMNLPSDPIADRHPNSADRFGSRRLHYLFRNGGKVFGRHFNCDFHGSGTNGTDRKKEMLSEL
jgi:hypothetical protein